jgi:hypothetical protein
VTGVASLEMLQPWKNPSPRPGGATRGGSESSSAPDKEKKKRKKSGACPNFLPFVD